MDRCCVDTDIFYTYSEHRSKEEVPVVEFRKLSIEEAKEKGVAFSSKFADESGELRTRVSVADADVTLTQVPAYAQGGWQNSHSHVRVVEITTIIAGRAIQVERLHKDELYFIQYRDGDTFKTHPGRAHNLFVFPGTLMLTLKLHDNGESRDWIADLNMDAQLRDITWDEALARC